MELNMELSQSQVLSAQQIQSMEILQMSYQELLGHINEALVENPVLDADEPPEQVRTSELLQKLKWLEAEDQQNRYYIRADREEHDDPLQRVAGRGIEDDTLYKYLEGQLDALHLGESVYRCARYAAACLDDSGYLKESVRALAESLGAPISDMEQAVGIIRSLDPPGVGCRDLRDCLLLQLERSPDELAEVAAKVVDRFLEKLGRSQYSHIARVLGEPEGRIRQAAELIRSLNPRPGSGFAVSEQVSYIRPDIVIVKFQDHFQILTGDYDFPTLRINEYYAKLLQESGDKEVEEYLGERIRRAKWLMSAIAQRRSTLLRCAEAILEAQEDFFRGDGRGLRPMTMADLAAAIGVHESTVSRAIRAKYLQCAQGVFPLSFFFSRRLGGANASADEAKRLLRELVDGEDKEKPLSDARLSALLEERGIPISRRTVAKYRTEMNIPSTAGRKIIS